MSEFGGEGLKPLTNTYFGKYRLAGNRAQSPISSEPDFSDLKVELVRAGLGLSPVLGSDGFPASLRCWTL